MADPILPRDLPAAVSVAPNAALIIDSGSGVLKATPGQLVEAGGAGPRVTTANLTTLENMPVSTGAALVVAEAAQFTWTPGDFSASTPDTNLVESNIEPLSEGAWLRQQADSIAFKQVGSNAVTRPAKEKVREIVSVLDFGADPTGTNNSSAAFSNAIATGKAVFVPAGIYLANVTISTSDVEIYGDCYRKTLLKPFTAANPVFTINGDTAGATIEKISISNLEIQGVGYAGHGISVINTSDTRGCDFLDFANLFIRFCNYGIHVAGRSIWNSFRNVRCAFNRDGWHIETDQACNAWKVTNCQAQANNRHGLFVRNTSLTSPFVNFLFDSFNSEANGQDIAQATCYGIYLEKVQCFDFINCYIERNGLDLTSTNSYGILVTGDYGRFVNIKNCWIVDSKFPVVYEGAAKSGRVEEILAIPSNGATVAVSVTSTADPASAKVVVDAKSVQGGSVEYTADVNGSYGARAIDWVSTPGSSIDFKFVDSFTINSSGGAVNVTTITGLQPGRVIALANSGANTVTLASGLMANGAASIIPGGTAKQYIVQGFPAAGKLYEIAQGVALASPPNVTGSRGGNAALADLLTKMAALGLITDGTSA